LLCKQLNFSRLERILFLGDRGFREGREYENAYIRVDSRHPRFIFLFGCGTAALRPLRQKNGPKPATIASSTG
jgi:hypothetical protein